MLTDPLLDVSLRPGFPAAYRVWIDHGDRVIELATLWYTESRGHPPGQKDVRHGLWRLINEPERWGTLRAAFQSTWPIGPEPPPPPPPPIDVDPRTADIAGLRALVISLGHSSRWWPEAESGDSVAAYRVTVDIARALASQNARWGLISKQGGDYGCTWLECGGGVPEPKYGHDVVAFRPGDGLEDWLGFDVVIGAGAPGAQMGFDGPLPRRPGNLWVKLPE